MHEAYMQGYKAASMGYSWTSVPYDVTKTEYSHWMNGWNSFVYNR